MCGDNQALPALVERIQEMLAASENVIVESNRLAPLCAPDLVLFVLAPAIQDWKASSSACIQMAHALVILGPGQVPQEASAFVSDCQPAPRTFQLCNQIATEDWIAWIQEQMCYRNVLEGGFSEKQVGPEPTVGENVRMNGA